MDAENDILIRICPKEGKITVEENAGGVLTRKDVDAEEIVRCFEDGLRRNRVGYATGFLPLNTISVWQGENTRRFVLWYPKRYADVSVYDTAYPHFPIPRLVFSFSMDDTGKVSQNRIGVVADEVPTPETVMYHYPFSNVSEGDGMLCVGANTMPAYRKLYKAANLPAFLLSIPNNFHSYYTTHNQMGMEYRELMEHLKDKPPEYYYSDVLIPNGKTLQDFIDGIAR